MAENEWFLVCTDRLLSEVEKARLSNDLDAMVAAGERPYAILNGYGATVVPIGGETLIELGETAVEGTWTLDWLLVRLNRLLEESRQTESSHAVALLFHKGIERVISDLEQVRDDGRIDELDAGIAPVVRLLREHGVNTFASCQGGEGHAFASPVVRIWPNNPAGVATEMTEIARVLSSAGYGGYYLKEINSYQTGMRPRYETFIEVEFWGDWQSLRVDDAG